MSRTNIFKGEASTWADARAKARERPALPASSAASALLELIRKSDSSAPANPEPNLEQLPPSDSENG